MSIDELILALGRKLKDASIDFSLAPDGAKAVRPNFPRALSGGKTTCSTAGS